MMPMRSHRNSRRFMMVRMLAVVMSVLASQNAVATTQLSIGHGKSFGMQSRAGSDGRVFIVDTLAAKGPGSLADALQHSEPRLVVFAVGGVIDLAGTSLVVESPHLTIAGQTAPEPGITVIRGGLVIRSHDVLVQHIRIRPGDNDQAARSGWEPDAITITGANAHDVVIDHVSASWAVDENLSASGPRDKGSEATSHDITFSHCLIAEALDYSSHRKGKHSKGALVHDFSQRVAFIGNLFAHNARRNPYFKAHTTGAVINNLIYNADSAAIEAGFIAAEWQHGRYQPAPPQLSIVGNVLRYGRDSFSDLPLLASVADAYLNDNLVLDLNNKPMPDRYGSIRVLASPPFWPDGIRALPAAEAEAYVLRHAGARPRFRDAIDQRIVDSVVQRSGRIIDSQNEVGGYPKPAASRQELTVPATDVASWLARFTEAVEYNNED